MLPGLGRQNTVVPRPPSMFERHLYSTSPTPYQQQYGNMPTGASYEPGQVVQTGQQYYAGSDGGWAAAGAGAAYGQALQPNYAQNQVDLARADTIISHYAAEEPVARSGSAQSYYADLQRQASQASSHQQHSSLGSGESYQLAAPQPAHLTGIAEADDDYALHRTGTLEDPNPQQTYFGNGQPQATSGLRNPYGA